jgi:hypothetical protein
MGSVIANSTPLIALAKMLIDTVERYKGVITILWHNTYMVGDKLRLYEKILRYCYEKGAWMTSGEEVWKWWSKGDWR